MQQQIGIGTVLGVSLGVLILYCVVFEVWVGYADKSNSEKMQSDVVDWSRSSRLSENQDRNLINAQYNVGGNLSGQGAPLGYESRTPSTANLPAPGVYYIQHVATLRLLTDSGSSLDYSDRAKWFVQEHDQDRTLFSIMNMATQNGLRGDNALQIITDLDVDVKGARAMVSCQSCEVGSGGGTETGGQGWVIERRQENDPPGIFTLKWGGGGGGKRVYLTLDEGKNTFPPMLAADADATSSTNEWMFIPVGNSAAYY